MKWNWQSGNLRPDIGPEMVAAGLCDLCMTSATRAEALAKMMEAILEAVEMWEKLTTREK